MKQLFALATGSMTPQERRRWWVEQAEREYYLAQHGMGDARLGPDIRIPSGSMKKHGNRKTVREIDRDCACQWYRRGSWDGNEWGL